MKILVVHPSFHIYGGAELAIVKFVDYLTKKKHVVDILTTILVPEVRADMKFNNLILSDSISEIQTKLNSIYMEYDVINFYNHPVEVMLTEPYPSVWYCNEPPDVVLDGGKLDPKEAMAVIGTISKIAVADKYNKDRVKELYGIDSTIIPYGIDYNFWSTGEEKKWQWKTKGKFVITQSAWIHPRKNQLKTLEIFKEVKPLIPNAYLILCGQFSTPYINQIGQYIKDNALVKEVLLDGTFGNREYVRKLYYSSDVLLHPIKNQGGWLTVFEAMCTGLPVVVSKEATCASIVKENNLGIVADTSEMTDIILDIYKNTEKYLAMSEKAKEYVKKNLTWKKYCTALENLLREATK